MPRTLIASALAALLASGSAPAQVLRDEVITLEQLRKEIRASMTARGPAPAECVDRALGRPRPSRRVPSPTLLHQLREELARYERVEREDPLRGRPADAEPQPLEFDPSAPHIFDPICAQWADDSELSVLTDGHQLEAANRPVHQVLCTWIQEGWSNLQAGDGPPGDRSYTPWTWVTRYPFDGPSSSEWDRQVGYPSAAGSPWLLNDHVFAMPLVGNDGHEVFDIFSDGLHKEWVKMDDYFFVLLDEYDPPTPKLDYLDFLGFEPIDAVTLGLAWQVLRLSVDRLHEWAVHRQSVGDLPEAFVRFAIFPHGDRRPILPLHADWIDGRAGQPIHVFEDDSWTEGTAGYGPNSQSVVFREGRVRGNGQIPKLRNAALRHWAYLVYGQDRSNDGRTRFAPIPRVTFEAAATRLAELAGILAHELLHMTWYNEFDEEGWGRPCRGPKAAPTALVDYHFTADGSDTTIGSRPTSRHYAHALLQYYVDGLIQHDVSGRLEALHLKWCDRDCPDYPSMHCPVDTAPGLSVGR